MQEELDFALQKIAELERRIEKYYQLLHIDNELDFIINGSYIDEAELTKIVEGTYSLN